ncbi:hypothetical protein CsSME_00017612 [Camellia sinensis var. sinensis]
MERWKGWMMSFNFKKSLHLPIKSMFVKDNSCLTYEAQGNGHGLVSLYKDMEACEGYADIQVMWEMIHSSHPPIGRKNRNSKRASQWRLLLCFKPT